MRVDKSMPGLPRRHVILLLPVIAFACLEVGSASAEGAESHDVNRRLFLGAEVRHVAMAKNSPAYPFLQRALDLFISGDLKQAVSYADMAIAKDSKLGITYVVRGMTYLDLEESKRAAEDLSKGQALDPSVAELHFYDIRTKAYADQQKWALVVADFDKAISLSPKEGWRYKERGRAYFIWHKTDLALRDITTAIKLEPKSGSFFSARAECFAELKRYKEALADYSEAIRLGQKDPTVYGYRADIYEKLGMKELAEKDRAIANRDGYQYMEGGPYPSSKP